ncbi:MAG: DUF4349 domain-containing protein [Nitrososphaerota archaeon]
MIIFLVVGLATIMISGYLATMLVYNSGLGLLAPQSGYQSYVKLGAIDTETVIATTTGSTSPAETRGSKIEATSKEVVVYSDQEKLIAYKADIDLKVDKGKIRETVDRVLLFTDMCRGYLTSMNVGEEDAYLTVKIPQKSFFTFIEEISRTGEVIKKSVSGMDMTDQILDLRARIRNAETLEANLLELLEKAEKVSEMLEVMRELSKVREEIEVMKAQLENLEKSVTYSTVSIWISEEMRKEYVEILFRVLDSRDSPVPNTNIYVKGDEIKRLITDEFGEAEAAFKKDQNITIMATFYRSDGEVLKAMIQEIINSNKTIIVRFDKSSEPPTVNLGRISHITSALIQYLVIGLTVLAVLVAPILLIIVVLTTVAQRMYKKMRLKLLA